MTTRRIFKSRTTRQTEIQDVLCSLLTAEVLRPSPELWLVSPWVTDLELLDNRTGCYDYLEPAWGQRKVQVSEILARTLANGGHLCLVTNYDPHNDRFLRQLTERVAGYGVAEQLKVLQKEKLHTKGILGDNFYLHGSMNLTIGGIEINDEQINLTTDKAAIASAFIEFRHEYGKIMSSTEEEVY